MNLSTAIAQQFDPLSLIKKATKLVLGGIFGGLLFVGFLILTETGAKLTLSLINEFTPYQIQYQNVSGTLVHQFSLEKFELQGPKFDAKGEKIHITWHLAHLLHNTPQIEFFTAKNTLIAVHPNHALKNKPTIEWQNIDNWQANVSSLLPFKIYLKNVNLNNFVVNFNTHQHSIEKLYITNFCTDDLSQLSQLDYQGSYGTLKAHFKKDITLTWDLTFPAAEQYFSFCQGTLKTKGTFKALKRNPYDLNNPFELVLYADKVVTPQKALTKLNLALQGNAYQQQGHLDGYYDQDPFQTQFKGTLDNHREHWTGQFIEIQSAHPQIKKMGKAKAHIDAKWNSQKILAHINFQALSNTVISEIEFDRMHHYLDSSIHSYVADIKTLKNLFPECEKISGNLTAEFKYQGHLNNLTLSGDLKLKQGKLSFVQYGSQAALNELHIILDQNKNLELSGNGLWGSGLFSIRGKGHWQENFPILNIHFQGKQLLLSDTPEYYIVADPDLYLDMQPGTIKVSGKIFVPTAEIKSLKNPEGVQSSSDVKIITKSQKTPIVATHAPPTRNIISEIDLVLGDKISYFGKGFKTNAQGQLHLIQLPNQPLHAKGKLTLHNGVYRAYGKKFDIQYGQILFSGGPIYDPVLDVRAHRTIQIPGKINMIQGSQSITAGIMLTGNLKSPKMTFFSNPSMSDADVMSYLIVGRPQSQINEAQAELLLQAVTQLTKFMGNERKDVDFDIAEKLKLDQFGITMRSDSTNNHHNPSNLLEDAVLVLGKQLSDRLYLHYSLGLADSANNIGLKYLLGKSLTFEASTGTQGSSADVLLSFESR